ncbi:MAG TPA: ZIP family metal transporter [Candidatus Omnitrophota bacterium]|nr:ZIP family metal transporter [Candidatus Omnitrophota bacterium]
MPALYTFLALTAVGLISLVGVFTLSLKPERLNKFLLYMVSFAVGALFGDAFLHLLPETFEEIGFNPTTSFLILLGIILFFILEKFLRWQHCHVLTSHDHEHPVATLNLIGDGVHNMLDGMIIASSFMVSPTIGFATTLAVIFHEIPQEIGDFGVLVHSGFSIRKALWCNFISALAAFVGAFLVFIVGPQIENLSVYVLPVTAGGFLYIAGSDLIPELHRHDVRLAASFGQLASILGGIAVMALLLLIE